MSDGQRLVVPPAIRAALMWIHHLESARMPLYGGDPLQILVEGRALSKQERDVERAALELIGAYFRDSETRVALDATTLQYSTEMEGEYLGGMDEEPEAEPSK